MFNLSQSIRIFVCTKPIDMRNGFKGLFGLTQGSLQQDPYTGHLFLFRSKRGDFLKVLWWDVDSFALFAKRLETDSFAFPDVLFEDGKYLPVEIERTQLLCLLEGIEQRVVDLSKRKKRNRRFTRRRSELSTAQ